MTSMRMRSSHQPIWPAVTEQREASVGQSVTDNHHRGPEECCPQTGSIGRRKSAVTFDFDQEACQVTVEHLAKEGDHRTHRSPGDSFSGDKRRMSAPELPPINQHGGRFGSGGHSNNNNGKLSKNHSYGSLADRGFGNNQSPNSLRSSSPSLSNKVTSRASTGSGLQSTSDQQSAVDSTSNVKLETLFEKNGVKTLESPRTATSAGGCGTHKGGKMPGVFIKNNNNNNHNNNLIPKGISRDATRKVTRAKKTPQMKHAVSETHLASQSQLSTGIRLPSRLERSSTSSVNNISQMNLTTKSSERKFRDRTRKNNRNKERISAAVTSGLIKNSLRGGTVNGMRKYSSTIALDSLNHANNKDEPEAEADGTDEDEEHIKRIHDWLIGADEAEPPPEPEIHYSDEPPQTDTALHIVYKGD